MVIFAGVMGCPEAGAGRGVGVDSAVADGGTGREVRGGVKVSVLVGWEDSMPEGVERAVGEGRGVLVPVVGVAIASEGRGCGEEHAARQIARKRQREKCRTR